MIRPIIIAEYHQSKHTLWKGIVFFGGLTLLLRLFGGSWAVLILLIAVLPNLGLSLGHGTFAEEFTKGQFKFLFSLPVGRFSIWGVKFISGLLGLGVFATVICTVMFAFPSQELRELLDFLPVVEVSQLTLIALLAAICTYSYGVGFFSITACSSPKIAGVISAVLLYLPLLTFWTIFALLGWIVPLQGIAIVLASAGVTFALGALVLFSLRNPFVETAWVRRLAALGIIGTTGAVMVAASGIALAWPINYRPPDFSNVLSAHASPDGLHIFLVTQRRLIQTHGYVITPDGTVVHDLGVGTSSLGTPELTWRPGPFGYSVAYTNAGAVTAPWIDRAADHTESEIAILSLRSGEIIHIPHLETRYDEAYVRYHRWSPDGRLLLGTKTDWQSEKQETVLIVQKGDSGEFSELTPAHESARISILPSGYAVIEQSDNDDQDKARMTLVNMMDGTEQRILLPPKHSSLVVEPNGLSVLYVHKYFEDQTVGYEILRQSIATGDRSVVVDRADLPRATFEQAARNALGWVGFTLSPGGRWLTCRISSPDQDADNRAPLIDLRFARRLTMPAVPDGAGYSESILSPQETKLLQTSHLDVSSEDIEDPEQMTTSMALRV
ncbi:MAG: hypothetical protein IH897_14725, partial [Planctomycetes bacterium]|nr:hypothetical protein [Planctomycetota bacterium]